MTLPNRFWDKVEFPRTVDGCWTWTAGTCRGYAQFRLGKVRYAHVLAYEELVAPVPDGLQLDHLCHDPGTCLGGEACPHRACIRPDHLVPATARENTLRGCTAAAENAAKTHCPKGHEYFGRPGKRACRTCNRAACAEYLMRNLDKERVRKSAAMRRLRATRAAVRETAWP